jgi:hypothetical protein
MGDERFRAFFKYCSGVGIDSFPLYSIMSEHFDKQELIRPMVHPRSISRFAWNFIYISSLLFLATVLVAGAPFSRLGNLDFYTVPPFLFF